MDIAYSRKIHFGTHNGQRKVVFPLFLISEQTNQVITLFFLFTEESDSDSDSDNDERERKIHVEIKPLNNGSAPISASVDELRATVENLSLSPLGGALSVWMLNRTIQIFWY